MTQPLTPYQQAHGALAQAGGTPSVSIMGSGAAAPAQRASAPAAPQQPTYKPPTLPYASNTPGFNGTGATPSYGQQSPNFLGLGQYVAPLFPINDQAITGAPSQGAGTNYGLNSVWGNLQNEIARSQGPGPMSMVNAPQGQGASYQAALGNAALANAAQGGYATASPTGLSTAGNTIGRQGALADLLTAQAAGGGAPSAADLQLRQGMEQGLGAQLAAMGSQRGVTNAALMNRNAADQAAAGQANLNAQMGIQRAQESQAAQQALGGVLSAQGQQAAGINQTAAQLQQQNAQFNAGNAEQAMLANTGYAQQAALANQAAQNAMTGGNLSALNAANLGNAQLGQQMTMSNLGYQNQDVLANQAAQLGNAQFQNQALNAALGAQTGIGEANRAAGLSDQQLQLQQMIAANQVNEQAYQAAANANANLTGAVIGGVTGFGGAVAQGIGNSGGGGGSWTGPAPEGAGNASGITGTASDGTWSGTLNNFNPAGLPGYTYSDENLKSGIEGGNPMMRSFLENYRKSTEPKVDVTEGERFRNPTYGRTPGVSSGGGGGIGSAIGGLLGGLAGSFIAPGVGTAIGAGVGSQAGGAIGNGVDPGSASGGGLQQTSQGSGVTADDLNQDYSAVSDKKEKTEVKEVGPATVQKALAELKADPKYSVLFGEGRQNFDADSMEQNAMDNADPDAPPSYGYIPQYPGQGWEKGPAPSDYNFFRTPTPLNVQSAQAMMQPPPPALPLAALRSAYPQLTAAVSDESEKEAVTSGNRGMQAFLSQANAQTQAQNNNGAQSNAFMASSLPPQAQVDTQMPSTSYGGGLPPFAQGGGSGVGYGMPQGPQGGGIYGGGIQTPGGYSGGGVMPQYMASSPAVDQSLAMAHPQTAGMQGPGAITYTPQAQQNYVNGFAQWLATQEPQTPQAQPASNINRSGVVLSDEEQKVKTNRGAGLQDMLDQLHAYQYRYKDTSLPGTMPGKRLGVMAQDLEKSPLGKQFIREDPQGHKLVDYGSMAGTQLAASAMLNDRLNQHEEMLKALSKRAA